MAQHPTFQPNTLANQNGVALIVVLVFLLLITITALTAMQTATIEERMTGHALNQQLAFQSAEAGLSAGETMVTTSNCDPGSGDLHPNTDDPLTNPENWNDQDTHSVTIKAQGDDDGDRQAQSSEYVLARVDPRADSARAGDASRSRVYADEFRLYRIIAKGFDRTGQVGSVLQETFRCRE